MIYSLLLIGFVIQIFFISCVLRKEYIKATILKTCAALTFIIVGITSNNKLLSLALIFGGIGDLFLELRHIVKKSIILFVIGTLFFLLEHFLLISRCVILCDRHLTISFFISLIVFCILRFLLNFCFHNASKGICVLGTIYLCFLSVLITFSTIAFIYNLNIENLLFMIGCGLFVTSDCLLMIHIFGKDKYWIHPLSLILYFLAQSIIAISVTL